MKPSGKNKTIPESGLYQSDIDNIINILQQYPEVEMCYLIGSRAMGNYRNGSDVDLVLKGGNITHTTISRISYLLNEETLMPYRFDVINFNTLRNQQLIDHTERVGKLLYSKTSMVQ